MRVCDRCKDPAKKSSRTMKDQHGGEIELCKECDAEFLKFLDSVSRPAAQREMKGQEQDKQAGKAAKR